MQISNHLAELSKNNDLYLTKYDQLLIYPDIPTKLIKENSDIFGDFILGNYNNCVSSSILPNFLKNAIKHQFIKKVQNLRKIIIDL